MNKIIGCYTNNGVQCDIDECDYVQVELLGGHAREEGAIVLISKYNVEDVLGFVWYLGKDCYPITHGTVDKLVVFGRGVKMHKFLIRDIPKGHVVDHINRNRLDNRLENLRVCTPKQNSYNTSRSKNDYKGVVGQSNGLWMAKATKDGQVFKIKDIETKEMAARTYDAIAEELFGEYAGKNFG